MSNKLLKVSNFKKSNKGLAILLISFLIIFISACSPSDDLVVPTEEASTPSDEPKLEELSQADVADNTESTNMDSNNTLSIYLSADQTVSKSSGRSIEQGIKTALSEVNFKLLGKEIQVVVLDHKGSSLRSKQHLDQFLNDKNALLIYSGLHSPPILESRDFINENEILMLDPWAAAGPITRYPSENNWIFRLSVDDTKAGSFITKSAFKEGYSRPFLVLEDTGWGKSNEKNMNAALLELEMEAAGTVWFNWSIGSNQAKFILREAKAAGADVIFFVGNAPEGKVFAKAMSELDPNNKLPIRSHWGITGGDFPDVIDKEIRSKIDLKFIQTSFSFINHEQTPLSKKVILEANSLFPDEIQSGNDIKAPTGFIHAYDLTKILIESTKNIDINLPIDKQRSELRANLEDLDRPIEGLIKTYERPFDIYSDQNPDAHEALGENDLRMAYYNDLGEIVLVK